MEEKYWKQFENSGRIEDYLSFVSSSGRDMDDDPSMRGIGSLVEAYPTSTRLSGGNVDLAGSDTFCG